jgi:hypothetical protein
MTLPVGYSILIYRGHFHCEVGLTYKDAMLSASKGGGYREDELVFPPIRTASLSYPTLHKDAMIEVSTGVFKDRLQYIWDFFRASKDAGNKPFLMKSPNPADNSYFLWVFSDPDLSIDLADLFMGTSGLKLEQVYVKGVVPDNADGSFDEE